MSLRETNLHKLEQRVFDTLVVGGGINGAVSAAALSARGCSVALIDRGDFAGFTSQESSNLVWGGIKYLENYEFPLVWKLCASRNRLLEAYPANVKEIRFFAAVEKGFRKSPLLLAAGSWLYWLMGRMFTRTPRLLTRARIQSEEPAVNAERFVGGVEYSDAYLVDNDARFVFGFVRSALNTGAIVANYVALLGAERDEDGLWIARCQDVESGRELRIRARVLVNAAGPYVDEVNGLGALSTQHRHVFSRGIHLIVPRITAHKRVLTFFDDTGRMFFVIPMGPRSVVGTTDTRVDRAETAVTDEDRDFLLSNANARLKLERPLERSDIIAERCGVRPLVQPVAPGANGDDDGEWFNLSRKHVIERGPGYVCIYGGKLTDCLNVGEEVLGFVQEMGITPEVEKHRWYGEPPDATRAEFFRQARLMRLDDLRESTTRERLSKRLWRRYGIRAFTMLEAMRREPGMEEVLIEGAEYLRCELYHAANTEMITRLEDFLRRRSKIALVVPHEALRQARGLREACEILFGDDAERRYEEYFRGVDADPGQAAAAPPAAQLAAG